MCKEGEKCMYNIFEGKRSGEGLSRDSEREVCHIIGRRGSSGSQFYYLPPESVENLKRKIGGFVPQRRAGV